MEATPIQASSAVRALRDVDQVFPFKGYIKLDAGAHVDIANTVTRYLPRGSRILDFGSGPCDRTAVVQRLGYECSAYDDMNDPWHRRGGNLARIIEFTRKEGVDFRIADEERIPWPNEYFDMVMCHHVLEHLHDSPRDLLNNLVTLIKPNGYLFLTMPNAGNVRKRIDLMRGRSNLPRYDHYYWSLMPWRGHVREYVRDDLARLGDYLRVRVVELRGTDHMLQKVPKSLRGAYLRTTKYLDGLKDSWSFVAEKPPDWTPQREIPDGYVRMFQKPGGWHGP